mmetsp:Transcript_40324/g.66037  ORF Transcript_40324/g.66037 Transcript_40324/m.66037 type:complete len:163 (+) Transcript_40324:742-1230(+)
MQKQRHALIHMAVLFRRMSCCMMLKGPGQKSAGITLFYCHIMCGSVKFTRQLIWPPPDRVMVDEQLSRSHYANTVIKTSPPRGVQHRSAPPTSNAQHNNATWHRPTTNHHARGHRSGTVSSGKNSNLPLRVNGVEDGANAVAIATTMQAIRRDRRAMMLYLF